MIREFVTVYRLYRKAHGIRYAARTAYRISVLHWDF